MPKSGGAYSAVNAAVLFKKGGEKPVERPKHNINKAGILGELRGNRVMCRWRSSLWKLVWKRLVLYMSVFAGITLINIYALQGIPAQHFETLVKWFKVESAGLPLTFMLGFYVSLVVKRWWEQYIKLPWPDEVATMLKAALVNKDEEENIKIRRTIVRYLILSYVLLLRRISTRMRKEYPEIEKLIETKLVRKTEVELIGDEASDKIQKHGGSNWWLPIKWSLDLVREAQKDGRMSVAPAYSNLVGRISKFRSSLTMVASYGHVPVPLVYTQVVHLAVYFFFAVELLSQQPLGMEKNSGKIWVDALFLVLKFLFYFGWLKVAETLYNPYGEDDDDFELVDLLKRHIKVCYQIVDDGSTCPPLNDDEATVQPCLDIEDDRSEEHGEELDIITKTA